jgi:hypothetical protein
VTVPKSLFSRFGHVQLPLDSRDVTTTLAGLDPGRDALLALFASAITAELTQSTGADVAAGDTVWSKAVAGTSLASKAPVQQSLPLRPSKELMAELKADFPLLCVYRSGDAVTDEYTISQERRTQPWRVDYVLGTLTAAEQRRLWDVLGFVGTVVQMTARRRSHPNYQSDAQVLSSGSVGFARVRALRTTFGPAAFADETAPLYYAASVQLETEEIDDFSDYPTAPFSEVALRFAGGSKEGLLDGIVEANVSLG